MIVHEERWEPKLLTELSSENLKVAWVWHGYLAKGSVTLLVGLWKAGKTTLLCWLAKALGGDGPGEFAGQSVQSGRTLFITEESESVWCGRRDKLQLGDRVAIISRPFLGRPDLPTWTKFVLRLVEVVKSRKFDLVVFDTLPNLSPIDDENDNAKTISALTPLHAIAEAGAAVLLCGHPRKGESAPSQAMRGAGATPAFVDIIVELRRLGDGHDSRRVLDAYSRYDDTAEQLVIDYDPKQGYRAVGTTAASSSADRLQVVHEILSGFPSGLTPEEIRTFWPTTGIVCPAPRTLKIDLDPSTAPAWLIRTGGGVKGDPHRYRISDSIPASAHTPTKAVQAFAEAA